MSAKRLTTTTINWVALAERVPVEQKGSLASFKAKSDTYLRSMMSNPETPPKLNWEMYKRSVPIPGMVDQFKQQYEGLKIDFPTDKYTSKIDEQWVKVKAEIDEFIKASEANINKYQKEIADINALLPYDEMTMEDYRDSYPEEALDPLNRPTFWPHTPDEQPDYVDPEAQHAGHGH